MTWHFQALRAIHPLTFSVSVLIIVLLSRWLDRAHVFYNEGRAYPADVYYTFVLACISTLLGTGLCIPKISRTYAFRPPVLFTFGLLMVAWLADAIAIVARKDNGSIMDKASITDNENIVDDDEDERRNEAARIGIAVMGLAWIEFVLFDLTLFVKYLVQKRRRNKFADTKNLDSDAKELSMDLENGDVKPGALIVQENIVEQKTPLANQNENKNGNNDKSNDNDANATDDNTKDIKNNDGEIYAEARYDFKYQEGSNFSFKVGDKIRITKKTNSTKDWWKGEINGKEGEFPADYVRLL
ncbi:13520_t:CDS:2 [Ambispora leptoticha]|uniref:13520_t:CDS:1 n=1 Tax=Ambispora leptoticha TaxID=144679 RepID=A0A9N8ZFR5_9GLOM|nr:13520_t:CDS:2 [Ambispora leptoticha]